MQIPLQITYRGFPPSEAIAAKICQQVEKLHRFSDRITSCQVVVEVPINIIVKVISTTCELT